MNSFAGKAARREGNKTNVLLNFTKAVLKIESQMLNKAQLQFNTVVQKQHHGTIPQWGRIRLRGSFLILFGQAKRKEN